MVLKKAFDYFDYIVIGMSLGMALVSAYDLRTTEFCAWLLSATWMLRAKFACKRADEMERCARSAIGLCRQLRRELDGLENNEDNHEQDQ